MNRELQELRNQKDGERQASVTEQTVGSASSDYQPPNEDAEDDLELRAPIISLDGFFLEPATATDIFTM